MESNNIHWFAVRTFSHLNIVRNRMEQAGFETYIAVQDGRVVFPNLLFVRCTERWVCSIRISSLLPVYVYCLPGTSVPAVISDSEMDNFKLIVAAGAKLEPVKPGVDFKDGDYVRVTDGPFKGVEGYILRIRNAKRLVVSIDNVGAFSTCYVPKGWCQKLKESN
ncbi:MAG: hypothetical protein MJY74_00940 [Bacteroidaceae bacterium]|nr:hypothetical protein [Bacteroidaceae bacterium]